MRRLWRLIPAYRALEAEVYEAAAARIQAEDAARIARCDLNAALDERDQSRTELNKTLKQVANYEALRSSPIVPFPDVYQPMPAPEPVAQIGEQQPTPPRTMREYEQAARAASRKAAGDRIRGLREALDAVTEN